MERSCMIWQAKRCGDVVALAKEAKFDRVEIKIANGVSKFNLTWVKTGWQDIILPKLVPELQAAGIKVDGWHYVYGNDPIREAEVAAERIKQLNLSRYIIDAEAHYKTRYPQARQFVKRLKELVPDTVLIGLSSYRFPALHYTLPWHEFLEICDFHMPQVYWNGSNNAGDQLKLSCSELLKKKNIPVIPVGSAYHEWGKAPTTTQQIDFISTAKKLQLPGYTWWVWDHALYNAGWWGVVAKPDSALTSFWYGSVTAYRLNVRRGPGVGYGITRQLSKGALVKVYTSLNGWGQISPSEWVSLDWIKAT